MPDKNKKRKNNKNKRKNKGQQQQNNNNRVTTEACDKSDCTQTSDLIKSNDGITETQKDLALPTNAVSNDNSKASTDINKLPKDITTSSTSSVVEIITKNTQILENYKVESPEKTIKSNQILRSDKKSKSLDNDDEPTIVEIVSDHNDEIEASISVADTNNIVITEFEPQVEWEKANDIIHHSYMAEENIVPGVLSIITIPLNVAECEEIKSMSPEEEKSLRQYLNTLKLSSNTDESKPLEIKSEIEEKVFQDVKRLRKKLQVEESYLSLAGPTRSLHVIDEEASGESSSVSRRHSYLSDKKSDEELEDDVFYAKNEIKQEMKMRKGRTSENLISQECIRVGAQIKNPEITEARGSWTTSTVEKMTGAEIVYLTDSSSSTSSLYDNNDNEEKNEDSDVSVRIITPTIEVVDTDRLLKNDFNSHVVKPQLDQKSSNNNSDNTNYTVNPPVGCNTLVNKENGVTSKTIPEESHEIVVLSTDSINTNLYVKDIDKPCSEMPNPSVNAKNVVDNYNLEIKVLKCELNDAINNLIKEVVSDSDTQEYHADSLERQDSSSSVGSSQCTAKYNPKCSSLNDISMAEFEETDKSTESHTQSSDGKSHVKEVITKIENTIDHNSTHEKIIRTPSLRDMCLEKICNLPYGEQILEELANVSERLQTLSDHAAPIGLSRIKNYKDISFIKHTGDNARDVTISRDKVSIPPAVQPRKSSLKITQEDASKTTSTKLETKQYKCLSPSQKMLMEKTNTLPHIKKLEEEEVTNKGEFVSPAQVEVPFKSQTGSRLLALLRNPSLTTSSRDKQCNYSKINDAHSSQSYTMAQDNTEYNIKSTNSHNIYGNSNVVKPVPPPKPRKYSSSFYESDESSDFVDNSFRSVKNHKKYFHFSTGNLSQEIEDDISSIQNMHRHYNDMYRTAREDLYPRRPSLPKDLCDKQMEYIRQKEKEVEAEINRIERERMHAPQKRGPRAPMLNEFETESFSSFNQIRNSQSHGVLPSVISPNPGKLSSAFSKSQEELLRNKMYSEYVSQMAEREERKQKKIIKITKTPLSSNTYSKSSSELHNFDSKVNNRIEKEFIDRAKDRWNKLGIRDPDTEDERNYYKEPKVIEHKIKVIDSGEEKDVQKLPNHLQDFVKFRAKDKSDKSESPGESDLKETSHGVVLCAVIILILTITKYILRLFRR